MVLPSIFIALVVLALHGFEQAKALGNEGEHVLSVVVLSVGTIPFSVYVFRTFSRLRDELEHRTRRLQVLHRASLSVTGEPSLLAARRQIARGARMVAEAEAGACVLSRDAAATSAGDGRAAGPALEEAMRAAVVSGAPVADAGAGVLAVPLRGPDGFEGAIGVSGRCCPEGDDALLLGMFAVAAEAGLQNARRIEETALVMIAGERERIARDLHDDVGQLLGFLTAKIQASQQLVARRALDQALAELRRLESATCELAAQVRESILGLRARIGPDRPLGSALAEYVADFGIQAGLTTTLEGPSDAGSALVGSVQYQLLRIAQEALTNVRRHAGARSVHVALVPRKRSLVLEVRDDGVGFDPEAVHTGFGLTTMQERARAIHGTFRVESAPGAGARITVGVPTSG